MRKIIKTILILLIPASIIFALLSGSVSISIKTLFTAVFKTNTPESIDAAKIIIQYRLPIVILAFFCGGVLSVCGAALQGILRNPLAEPFVLGVSSASAFGLVLAVILGVGGSFWIRTFFAFAIGMAAVSFVIFQLGKKFSLTGIILSGIVISSFFSALTMLSQSFLSPVGFKSSISLLMGQFSVLPWGELFVSIGIMGVLLLIIILKAPELDLLSTGIEHAKSTGVNTRQNLVIILFTASLATAITVSLCGVIGFVGLIAPHIIRSLSIIKHKHLLIFSFLGGGSFMVISETISRSIASMGPLPVGAVTAFIGAPFFLLIFWKKGQNYA